MKYEIKATGRVFLPLYAALAIMSLLFKAATFIPVDYNSIHSFIFGMGALIFITVIIAIFVLTVVMMIQRFYRNLLCDEGYLMFTLPVKPRTLIVSKLIVTIMWIAASFIVTFLSILFIALDISTKTVDISDFNLFFSVVGENFDVLTVVYILELILVAVSVAAAFVLMIYASLALGNLSSKHKLLWSFGAYIGLYISVQFIIMLAVTLCTMFNLNQIVNGTGEFATHAALLGVSAASIVFAAVFFCNNQSYSVQTAKS